MRSSRERWEVVQNRTWKGRSFLGQLRLDICMKPTFQQMAVRPAFNSWSSASTLQARLQADATTPSLLFLLSFFLTKISLLLQLFFLVVASVEGDQSGRQPSEVEVWMLFPGVSRGAGLTPTSTIVWDRILPRHPDWPRNSLYSPCWPQICGLPTLDYWLLAPNQAYCYSFWQMELCWGRGSIFSFVPRSHMGSR